MTKKAVILAAGRGGRLQRHTDEQAKCLVRVHGRPLIDHVLGSLRRAGIEEAVVVVGYRGELVQQHLGDGARFGLALSYAWNRELELGNAGSLSAALPLVSSEPFLLTMSDHLCTASLLRSLLASSAGRSTLAVDRSDLGVERTHEATKVATAAGMVTGVGKTIARWDAIDTGISCWSAGAFHANGHARGELAALMAGIARFEGGVAACDVSGHFWLDVDTEDDLRLAERLLQDDAQLLD